MKRVSMNASVPVADDEEVLLSIVVGDAQLGASRVLLGTTQVGLGQIADLSLGLGSAVRGQTIKIKSVVTDVNDATNHTSITYRVGAQELSQTATVDEQGDSVIYRATIQLV
jgi:hypothetical protein